jgi:hypothetical protein
MKNISPDSVSTGGLERFLVVIGAALCLIASVWIWLIVSRQQPMWPLPDLYLLEMIAASALAMFDILSNESKQLHLRGILVWATVGVLLAFVVMGILSIGFLYAPVAGLFAIAAILSDRRRGHNLLVHLGIGLAAALIQAALMLVVVRLL